MPYIQPTSISDGEFGLPRLRLFIQAPAIEGSTNQVGVPNLLALIHPNGIASATEFGTAKTKLFVKSAPIVTKEAWGYCRVASSAITVEPQGIRTKEFFGYPSIVARIKPTGIASQLAFGSAGLRKAISVPSLETIGGWFVEGWLDDEGWFEGTQVGTPSLVQQVNPAGIASEENIGEAFIALSDPRVSPTGVDSAEAFGIAVLLRGLVQIQAASIDSAEALGTLRLRQFDTVYCNGISSEAQLGVPNFFCHAVYLRPAGITSSAACGRPLIGKQVQLSFDLCLITDLRNPYNPLPRWDLRQFRIPLSA